MAFPSSKDILILILSLAVLLLGGYVVFDKFHTTADNNRNNNLNNFNYINTSINNYSINNNVSHTNNNNENNELNITTNENEFTNNNSDDIIYVDYSKNVPLDDLFMDLPYSNVLDISEGYKKGKIKTYIKNGNVINFDVRNYKPNLDNPEYIKVSKTELHFKYGNYYKYTYSSEYENSTPISYCYYRKIGNYHITMGFSEVNKDTSEMWLKWNEYIYNLYKEKNN
jgi:hypothetical protein